MVYIQREPPLRVFEGGAELTSPNHAEQLMNRSSSERACLLFTDLVGSTWLWERNPDRMTAALIRHEAILERTIIDFGGRIFKWTGDGCCASFPVSGDAPGAALAVRTAFRSERWNTAMPLRIRIAIHAGPVRRHRGVDLVGRVVNQTSRLLEQCSDGQVLATAAALDSQSGRMHGGEWHERGRVVLRDIVQPLAVFEAADLESVERPVQPSVRAIPQRV